MKVVPDTNILISATIWENSISNKLIRNLVERDIDLFSSFEILEEYKKVLKRDFKYNDEEIQEIIIELLSYIQIIEPTEKLNVIKEDPDDNKILECATASKSEYIITYDNHLLNLKEFRGIKIVRPEKLIFILNRPINK